jgi:hypothetical protein
VGQAALRAPLRVSWRATRPSPLATTHTYGVGGLKAVEVRQSAPAMQAEFIGWDEPSLVVPW